MDFYVELPQAATSGPSAVTSVNGQTGVVVLTKSNIGLSNADNTSDANKPVSTAQQTALNLKANLASPTFTGTVSGITKSMVGLGNADNTSDANKPVSTAQQTALNLKQDQLTGSNNSFLGLNNSGVPGSIPGWQFDPTLYAAQVSLTNTFNSFTGFRPLHAFNVLLNPTEDAPNATTSLFEINGSINSIYNAGTNGLAARFLDNNFEHNGSGDIGTIAFVNSTFDIGNGTDPITSRGIAYSQGFGEFSNNVTITDSLQGYTYQFNIAAGATVAPTAFSQGFADNININTPFSFHTSFASNFQLSGIQNNRNASSFTANPTISSFTGNAGYTGLGVFGNYLNYGTGGWSGVVVNPASVQNSRFATGIDVNMANVVPFAGVKPSITVQDIFYETTLPTSVPLFIEYLDTVNAGDETATIVGDTISVNMDSGASTATQIKAALDASSAFTGVMQSTITGVGSNTQTAFASTVLSVGADAGTKYAARFVGDVDIQGSLAFTGGLSLGALDAFSTNAIIDGTGDPGSINTLISELTLGDNLTRSNVDILGVNTAALINVGTNSTINTGFLGIVAMAIPAVVSLGSGSSIDRVAGAAFVLSLDTNATGGTIQDLDLCRALAIPNAITNVSRLKGFTFDLPFGDPATATWGFYASPDVPNYFAGSVVIGTSELPTNANVGLEINSTDKVLLCSRLSTIERDALAAIDGMILYNTTTNKLQVYAAGVWVDLH